MFQTVIMSLAPVLVSALFLLIFTNKYGDRVYRIAASLAFVGHVGITLVLIDIVPYNWDIRDFHQVAVGIQTGEMVSASSSVMSFGTVQGLFYLLFTPHPETIGVFNGFFAVLVAIPAMFLSTQLYPNLDVPQHGVMAFILFLPLPFFLLSVPMRDALSVLVFFSILALAVLAIKTRSILLMMPLIPLWGILYLFRPELALVFLVGVAAAVSVKIMRNIHLEIPLAALATVLGVLGAISAGLFAQFMYSLDQANAQLLFRASGGAVYLDGMQYSSWFDIILATPARALYFQFAPFPLHVEQVFHLLAFTMTPVVIVLFVSAARSLHHVKYDETVAVLLAVVYFAGISGYGLINSNFGTNVRHRIVFDFLLVVIAAPVIKHWELCIREWLGVVPSDCCECEEQQRKTKKLDGGICAGGQYTNDADE